MTKEVETMFQTATRKKLRFETDTHAGITTEDLWDLKMSGSNSLDSVAKILNRAIKQTEEESFVVKKSNVSAELQLKFDIVLHIISVLQEEAETRVTDKAKKQQKEKILAIMARKEEESYENLSMEDLKRMLAD